MFKQLALFVFAVNRSGRPADLGVPSIRKCLIHWLIRRLFCPCGVTARTASAFLRSSWAVSAPTLVTVFGSLHLDQFSHRFLAGNFGFCLPVGLLMVMVFFVTRSPLVGILPARLRPVFRSLCHHPLGSAFVVVISVLVGAWTHLFFDSVTHEDGWLVRHLPFLQGSRALGRGTRAEVCDLLYAVITFFGVAWLAVCYQDGWKGPRALLIQAHREPNWFGPFCSPAQSCFWLRPVMVRIC